MTGDGVIDLTPDDAAGTTLPIPPRALTVAPDPGPPPGGDDDTADAGPVAAVTLRGRSFPLRPQGIGLMSLMQFATLAKRGKIDSEDLEGLLALYDLLRSCIAADAWDEFRGFADDVGVTGEELIHVVKEAIQAKSGGRPTQPLSSSPGGQPTTGPSSGGGSSSPASSVPTGSLQVQQRYEQAGRADIAQVIKRAREASTRSSTG